MGNKKGYWAGNKNPKFKHGLRDAHARAYNSWNGAIYRCSVKKSQLYKYYGGRGITVCARWQKFENFLIDMGDPPKGFSLERKNNSEGYNPENCIWASNLTQANNTRACIYVTLYGVRKTLSQWSRTIGVPFTTLRARYLNGWPADKILSKERFVPRPNAKLKF